MRSIIAAHARLACLVLSPFFPAAASATTLDFAFHLSGSAFVPPGLVVETNIRDGSFSLDLDPHESATVELFSLWTNETHIDPPDLVARSLLAGFAMPAFGASGGMSGTTIGHSEFGDIFQWGTVSWGEPLILQFGQGGEVSILLQNALFNFGFFGLRPGPQDGAIISATVTYLRAPAQVPLPASGLSLGMILAGLLAAAARRRADCLRVGALSQPH